MSVFIYLSTHANHLERAVFPFLHAMGPCIRVCAVLLMCVICSRHPNVRGEATAIGEGLWFREQPLSCQLNNPVQLEKTYGVYQKVRANASIYKSCLEDRKDDFEVRSFRGRHLYILGNSVYRHYSFAVPMIFDNVYNSSLIKPRSDEKNICQGDLHVQSCDHYTRNRDTMVRFMWKNLIGSEMPLYDDSDRDICRKEAEAKCLPKLFIDAKPKDILLLGAVPADTKCFQNRSFSSIHTMPSSLCRTVLFCNLTVEYSVQLLRNLMNSFPGAIIVGSYPHVRENRGFTDRCQLEIATIVSEAVNQINSPRMRYVYLTPLQRDLDQLYLDWLHHPGVLSEYVLRLIYLQLSPTIPSMSL